MRKGLVIFSFLGLILSFQNCAKSPQDNGVADPGETPITFNKVPASDYKSMTLWDYDNGQFLDLDLKTGRMTAFEEYGYVRGDQFCLSETEKTTLAEIMENAEICNPKNNGTSMQDQACSMVYRYPYASLTNGSEEIKLGEKTNGCELPIDLCGEKGQLLKKFVASVVATIKSHSCP